MKKNFKVGLLFIAVIMLVAGAFGVSASSKMKSDSTSSLRINELYWYAADNTTYTGRFQTLTDEMAYLAQAQPLYNFYASQVSGSVPYEYGYTVQSPSGSPAQTIYRKAK